MAIERVEKLLRATTQALDSAGVEYAVVGGNAVAEWVSTVDEDMVRFTKDVDILVRRADLTIVASAMDKIGLVQTEVLTVTIFVDKTDPKPSRGVHLIMGGERIRSHYVHSAPDPASAVRLKSGYRVVDLPALIGMKLQSGRPIDVAHLVDLKSVGLITPGLIAKLPCDLQMKLSQVPEPDTQ
jgi:hypothetical protein